MERFETHSHSCYSNIRLLDSINTIDNILKVPYEKGMSGVCLTDHECLCGAVELLGKEKELKEKGELPENYKCGIGNEIYLTNSREKNQKYYHFILIAKDEIGFRQLCELSSKSWYYSYFDRGMERVPTLKSELQEVISRDKGHVIATSACFQKGTKVRTSTGEKNIEDITAADFVLNKDGEWEKVNFPTSRFYQGKGREITFFENGNNKIRCTENHQFLVSSRNWEATTTPFRWVEAKDLCLKSGGQKNYCLFPISVNYTNENVIFRKEWEKSLRGIEYAPKYLLPDEVRLTPELMRFFGLWLGDGHISITEKSKRVGITFSEEEFEWYWEDFVKKATEELQVKWTITKNAPQHKIEITSSSIELVELFYSLFGLSHAQEKKIPKRLKHISEELDWNLFFGYALADGYFRKKERDCYVSGEFVGASISKQLILDMKEILQSLGIRSSFSVVKEKIDKNSVHHCESYYLSSANNAWIDVRKKTNNSEILNILRRAQKHDEKKHSVYNGIKYKRVYIKSVQEIDLNEQVYCLNDNSHSFCCEGVIVHNCIGGELPTLLLAMKKDKSKKEEVENFLSYCKNLFEDDFYLEVAPGTREDQIYVNKMIWKLSKAFGIKMIYGTDAHYQRKETRFVHKAYLNSKEGEREVDDFYEFSHFMTNEEAWNYFQSSYDDVIIFEEMCKNSMEIYNKIQGYKGIFRNPIIPRIDVKDYPKKKMQTSRPTLDYHFSSEDVQERYWVNECWNALIEKGLVEKNNYIDRLETEADIIKTVGNKLGNCLFEYFNTFQHFIELFWKCGSLNGPGRGSSVCYLSNFLLGITQLDPIEWELAEWRFLNKDRLELPDIDTDLSPSKRPLIFKKIREERGELRLLQVATFGTEGTKSAILTACRGYRSELYPEGIDVDTAQYIAGLIPSERGFLWTLDEAVHGNVEKDRKPIQEFIREVEKYPGLLDIMFGIEGLVNKRSQHASGVIIYNEDPWNTGAVMKSPNGELTTQFSLHDAEKLGDTKFDFLVTEICDKIVNTINLLQKDGFIEKDYSLKQVYQKYLHPSVIDLKDEKIWDTLDEGKVNSLFQFDSDTGGQAIAMIQPRNPIQMMMANALTRLMGEKGKERPIERYVRLKNDISQWYKECRDNGLTEEEIKVLEPYYLPVSGCPTTQEKLMLLCMEPKLGNFSLADANSARKVCSKKQLSKIPILKEKFVSACPTKRVGEYVWQTAIEPQMSYAFAEPHALAYSFVAIQILVLVTKFPVLYWNCGCLITDSGSDESAEQEPEETEIVSIYEPEDFEEYEYEDLPDTKEKVKKKVKTPDYGKVATAIGKFQERGITILPPNINESSYTFTPVLKENAIAYGLRGITRVPEALIKDIFSARPFTSYQDFFARVKIGKLPATNLIKSGAFDSLGDRKEVMNYYLTSVADTKTKLTLQNMSTLIAKNLIPEEMKFFARLWSFNKFLKTNKEGIYYLLNEKALNFIVSKCDADLIDAEDKILQKVWDTYYKKAMEPMRVYLKDNQEEVLEKLNREAVQELWDKYAGGTISRWEMDSISFYYHPHELSEFKNDFTNFFDRPEEPEVAYTFPSRQGQEVKVMKTYFIAGTVINKNKLKNSISLLTPEGVVTVKIWKNQYSLYDKQISEKGEDGKKHVLEKSWFTKGTLLMCQGFRRGDSFVLKKDKKSGYEVLSKIEVIDGKMKYITERIDEE